MPKSSKGIKYEYRILSSITRCDVGGAGRWVRRVRFICCSAGGYESPNPYFMMCYYPDGFDWYGQIMSELDTLLYLDRFVMSVRGVIYGG